MTMSLYTELMLALYLGSAITMALVPAPRSPYMRGMLLFFVIFGGLKGWWALRGVWSTEDRIINFWIGAGLMGVWAVLSLLSNSVLSDPPKEQD